MKHVVIDARISGTTTGRYVDKLVEYLHKLEQSEIRFTILARSHRLEYMRQTAPNFALVAADYPDFSFGEQLGLLKALNGLKADLVHFPMVQQPLLYHRPKVTSMLDLTTLRYKDPLKNKLIFTAKQKIYLIGNKLAARSSRQIITISNYVRDELIHTFKVPATKITTTYNAADFITDKAVPVASLEGKQFIFYAGRPQPHKNLQRLIEAFAILRKEQPDLHLALVGKTDALYKDLAAYVQNQDIANVIFTDFVSEGQLKWLYQHTGAYVFPSLSEGFGLPGLEAMVHGAPVVSSNATCLPEIYGDAAVYFDPLDLQDIANKIIEVLDNKQLSRSLRAKGEAQSKKYSWATMAQQTLAVYKKALSQ